MAKAGYECFHCKQWIRPGEAHDCWTTTEAALTKDLPEDLRDAWERIREAAASLGEQRIYASLNSIMFSRTVCYCFVRPKPKRLEVCFFLGRTVKAPQIRKVVPTSRVKHAHIVHVVHRDQVEPPLTGWLKEAYEVSPELSARGKAARAKRTPAKNAPKRAKPAAKRKAARSRKR